MTFSACPSCGLEIQINTIPSLTGDELAPPRCKCEEPYPWTITTTVAQFGRLTIIAAVETLETGTQADITRFMLEHALEATSADVGAGESKRSRGNSLIQYLLQNPALRTSEGGNLTDAIVRDLVEKAIARWGNGIGERFPSLLHGLRRDGFEVVNGELRRAHPELVDLPRADDEVHSLLRSFGFHTATGHLDQAITNHTSGNWAASNGQLRSFVEALTDSIAERLEPNCSNLPAGGWARVEWLANLEPPFFLEDLNEWQTVAKTGRSIGFIYGVWQRLHPQGPHPGLSDEDDATFRLHLVLPLARLLLRRLKDRCGIS